MSEKREIKYDGSSFLFPSNIKIKNNCKISYDVTFVLSGDRPIIINDNCVLRSGCTIYFGTILGKNVQLGHDVFIRENCQIGDGTKIGTKSLIEWGSKIGKNCLIEGNVFISECTVIEDDVFMGPQSRTTSDKYMGQQKPYVPMPARICRGARIGAGVTILPGVVIGEKAVIGAGCVVTKNVPPKATMIAGEAEIYKR